jgi:hypothetical protein
VFPLYSPICHCCLGKEVATYCQDHEKHISSTYTTCQNRDFRKLNQATIIATAVLSTDYVGNEQPYLVFHVFKLVELQLLH